jgi:hypothetical protein
MINTSICFAFETVIIYIKHVMCTRKCVSWLLLFFFFFFFARKRESSVAYENEVCMCHSVRRRLIISSTSGL